MEKTLLDVQKDHATLKGPCKTRNARLHQIQQAQQAAERERQAAMQAQEHRLEEILTRAQAQRPPQPPAPRPTPKPPPQPAPVVPASAPPRSVSPCRRAGRQSPHLAQRQSGLVCGTAALRHPWRHALSAGRYYAEGRWSPACLPRVASVGHCRCSLP